MAASSSTGAQATAMRVDTVPNSRALSIGIAAYMEWF